MPTTHLFTVRDRNGTEIAAAPPVRTLRTAAEDLADGELLPTVELVSVHRVELTAGTGTSEDVTARVLHGIAAYLDADGRAVRPNLHAAFAAYDVPLPEFVEREADHRDSYAEHRLTAADYGISARAA